MYNIFIYVLVFILVFLLRFIPFFDNIYFQVDKLVVHLVEKRKIVPPD